MMEVSSTATAAPSSDDETIPQRLPSPSHSPYPPKSEYEKLLECCRTAVTRQEQDEQFQSLLQYSQRLRVTSIYGSSTGTAHAMVAHETIIRCMLTEWSYSQVSTGTNIIDQVLDSCGVMTTMITCSALLKEIVAGHHSSMSVTTKAQASVPLMVQPKEPNGTDAPITTEDKTANPLSHCPLSSHSVVEGCWKTIQRIMLNGSFQDIVEVNQTHPCCNDQDDDISSSGEVAVDLSTIYCYSGVTISSSLG
jgi:hypothetical protein